MLPHYGSILNTLYFRDNQSSIHHSMSIDPMQ